jgi:ribosomal protein S18 acetylase RimI-like enzyme
MSRLSVSCGKDRLAEAALGHFGTVRVAAMAEILEFLSEHAEGVSAVCLALGWPTYSDVATAQRGCAAPGVCTVVAVDSGNVIGFAQAFTDGEAASYLSQVGVVASHRRQGIGRRLVQTVFQLTGAARMDLVTMEDAEEFYRSFNHRKMSGYRIYPTGN